MKFLLTVIITLTVIGETKAQFDSVAVKRWFQTIPSYWKKLDAAKAINIIKGEYEEKSDTVSWYETTPIVTPEDSLAIDEEYLLNLPTFFVPAVLDSTKTYDLIRVVDRPLETSGISISLDRPEIIFFTSPVHSWSYPEEPFFHAFFNNRVIFSHLEIEGLTFQSCFFKKRLTVSAEYEHKAYVQFSDCIFEDGVSFRYDGKNSNPSKIFDKWHLHSLSFIRSEINGKLDLSFALFDSTYRMGFASTPLPDTIDFSYAKIIGPIDLSETYLGKGKKACYINLFHTDVEKITMQYRNFHLYFPDSVYSDMKFYDAVSSTYEQLLNSFAKRGFTESHKKLNIDYQDWQQQFTPTLWISDLWWKYGYEKWRIVPISLFVIFIFAVFNLIFYEQLQGVYPMEKLHWSLIKKKSHPLVRGVKKFFTTFLYTGVIFFRFNLDLKNMNFFPLRYSVIIIFQYSVGLVCTGFLINWILK